MVRLRIGDEPGDEYGPPIGWSAFVDGCEGVSGSDMERVACLPLAGEVVLGGGAAPCISIVRVA